MTSDSTPAVRYALIVFALGAFLLFGWWGVGEGSGIDPIFGSVALLMAAAAYGLVRRQAWAAYLLSAVTFVCLPPFAFFLLFMATAPVWDVSRDSNTYPAWLPLILLTAFGLVVTVAVLAFRLGRSIRRETRRSA